MLYAAYNYPHGFWYGLFYYGKILIALILVIINIKKIQKPEIKRQTYILLFGLLSFTVPMIIAYFLYPLITEVVESVMCKFAFLFAITLTYFSLEGRKQNEVYTKSVH
jgi:Ca2+/Na+ antiporter